MLTIKCRAKPPFAASVFPLAATFRKPAMFLLLAAEVPIPDEARPLENWRHPKVFSRFYPRVCSRGQNGERLLGNEWHATSSKEQRV